MKSKDINENINTLGKLNFEESMKKLGTGVKPPSEAVSLILLMFCTLKKLLCKFVCYLINVL